MSLLLQSIGISLVLAVFISELTGLSAAGLIVPGYFAYYWGDPVHLLLIVFATIYTWLTERFVSRFTIMFGKRVFALTLLSSFVFMYLMENILYNIGFQITHMGDAIGYFIPALIVIYIGANGFLNTFLSLALLTLLVRIIMIVLISLNFI